MNGQTFSPFFITASLIAIAATLLLIIAIPAQAAGISRQAQGHARALSLRHCCR
jgi:hypothetical protein